MSSIKRLGFLLLCLVSCGVAYFLIGMSMAMTSFLFEGDTSVLRWAAVVSITAVVLFLLWRNGRHAYKTLWKAQTRKEKPKIEKFKRLEMSETEIADSELPAEQSMRKSKLDS